MGKLLQTLFVFLLVTQICFGQWVWTKYEDNPVLTGSGISTWDKHVMGPWVIFNSDSNRYEMFFFASMETNPDPPYRIGIAYSTDKINWTKHPDPIISPTPGFWDSNGAYHPCVIREDSVYKMWYMAYKDAIIRICYATSIDGGLTWTKHPEPVLSPGTAEWESTGIAVPLVLKVAEGYIMYYSGQNSSHIITKIGRAVSTDGINWQRDTVNSPVLIAGTGWETKIFASGIIIANDIYYLTYCGYTYPSPGGAGGLAFSTDEGLTFQKYPIPVISKSSSDWDYYFIETDGMLYEDSTFYMWYAGSSNPYLMKIGLATSPFQKIVWATESYLDKAYMKINTDSILFRTRFCNLYNLEFIPHLIYINSDSTFIDSLILYDDGLHWDSLANDGLYGAYIPPKTTEDWFLLSVSTQTNEMNGYFVTPLSRSFTTTGPVVINNIEYTALSNFRYTIKPYLKNDGTTAAVTNLRCNLFCEDPWVTSLSPAYRNWPDLQPGEIKTSSLGFTVSYDSATFPGYFNFRVEVMSNGWVCWTDSMQVIVTGVEDESQMPLTFNLEQNYPNPFNPGTVISYQLPMSSDVELKVFDVLGNEIATLVDEYKTAGRYEVEFSVAQVSRLELASGIYFYQLKAGDYTAVKKMLLIK